MAVSSVLRCRIAIRSIADLICKSKPLEHGQRNDVGKLELLQAVATSVGDYRFMHGVKSPTMSMQIEIVDALRVGERRRASNLLLGLAHGDHSLKADDFLNILVYCAKSPDPLFVMETWKVMEEKEISLDNRCHILMVQSLCKGGYLDEAFDLINYLGENHGIYPSLPAYNDVLRACADVGSLIHANQCLDQMEQRMMGKDRDTYVELVKLAVWQQSLPAVHELWKDFSKHYCSSIFPLRKFIWSFARLGDLKSALEVLHHMVDLVINRSIFIDEMSKGKFNSSSLDIPLPLTSELSLPKGHLEKNENSAPSVSCKEMDRNSSNVELQTNSGIAHREVECIGTNTQSNCWSIPIIRILTGSFNDLIHACAQRKNHALAEQLMLEMQNLGLEPTRDTYDGYIKAVVPKRGFSYGLEILQTMLEKNLKPLDSTLVTISLSCCAALELDLAEYLVAQISDCQYPLCFNALLVACDKMNQPERAVRVLAKMRQIKTRPDILTYEVMFSLFGTVNGQYESGSKSSQAAAAKRIKAIELDMEKNGIQHSLQSMKNLLQALGNEGMINELIDYLFVAENLLCNNNTNRVTELYNAVLHSLVDAKETKTAIKLFKNMKLCGVLSDAATYSIMTECCFRIKCVRSASALLSLMIRDGIDLRTISYTNMIKVMMASKDFDEALDLLDQACSQGFQPDLILFNEIIKMASRRGRIDVVEFAVQQMHLENISPDTSTCYSVFSVYAMSGFHNTALEALQVLTMRMILKDNCIIEERKRELEENFVYAEDPEVEEQILQSFGGPEETVTLGILLLRFCALLGCPISWSPEQSPWARRLSAIYHAQKRTNKEHFYS